VAEGRCGTADDGTPRARRYVLRRSPLLRDALCPRSLPCVVALLDDRVVRARLEAALRDRATVLFSESTVALLEDVARVSAVAVLLPMCDRCGTSTAPIARRVRRAFPSVSLIGFVASGRRPANEILDLARAGVHALIFDAADGGLLAVRAAISDAVQRCAVDSIATSMLRWMPKHLHPVARECLEQARTESSVETVARALGVHRRTLTKHLARAQLPPPRVLLAWCKVRLAARLLEDPERSVEQVAMTLEFPSAAALRNMLKRYTGRCPGEIRTLGGLQYALRAFECALLRANASRAGCAPASLEADQ
jgi:AraC-like DNA-binding protein